MGKLKIDKSDSTDSKPVERMLVMEYADGLTLDEIPEFIAAINTFVANAKTEPNPEQIKLYFLPTELAGMLMKLQEK